MYGIKFVIGALRPRSVAWACRGRLPCSGRTTHSTTPGAPRTRHLTSSDSRPRRPAGNGALSSAMPDSGRSTPRHIAPGSTRSTTVPHDYQPPTHVPPRVGGPHEPPEAWSATLISIWICQAGISTAASAREPSTEWAGPNTGGHWFNAVNDAGTVRAVGGQSSRVETWPPSVHGFGWDESRIENSDVLFFTSDGKVVRHDQP